MLQRIQSLFLLLSVAISALLIYLPVYQMVPGAGETATAAKQFTISSNAILMILNGAIGIFSFVTIFLFKKRNLQIRICNLIILLGCILLGLLFFVADAFSSGMNQKVEYMYGSYLPILQVIFIFLAGRFIKSDENLVRSADRLR